MLGLFIGLIIGHSNAVQRRRYKVQNIVEAEGPTAKKIHHMVFSVALYLFLSLWYRRPEAAIQNFWNIHCDDISSFSSNDVIQLIEHRAREQR